MAIIKKEHSLGQNQNDGFSLRPEKESTFSQLFKKALDSQVFFNSRIPALKFIEKIGEVSTAMLTLNIRKTGGLLGNYKLRFSLLYSKTNGQIFKSEDFYTVELPGKAGLIPDYILNELKTEDSLEIQFTKDDLSVLYDERDIKIHESANFNEIEDFCQKKRITKIKFIDRVFYTRIEYYSLNGQGVDHFGALYEVPDELSSKLYPGEQVECTF